MRYYDEINGVRALAVTAVILFHLGIPGFEMGWLGVQLFFCISGFLITGILLDLKKSQQNLGSYLGIFYARRTLRIFPLYYFYLSVNFFLMIAFSRPTSNYPYYILYLQNYIFGTNRFSETQGFLAHTWSLAVEEQFYLLWPLVIYTLKERALFALSVMLCVFSPIFRHFIFLETNNPYLFFSTLPSCLDSLCAGSVLYFLNRDLKQPSKEKIFLFGIIGCMTYLVYAIHVHGIEIYKTPTEWVPRAEETISAFNIFSLSLIGLIINSSWLKKLFSMKFATHIGEISYGLYMYHGLCISFVSLVFKNLFYVSLISIPMAYVVSLISYKTFESYFIGKKNAVAKLIVLNEPR